LFRANGTTQLASSVVIHLFAEQGTCVGGKPRGGEARQIRRNLLERFRRKGFSG
jgi:hypothetical protein